MNHQTHSVLAISGSLRKKSLNTVFLQAIIKMFPSNVQVSMYEKVDQLPHFNPDLDGDDTHPVVSEWRKCLQKANGVLICTPEYAKGIPGSLKNALDWIVSSGEFVNKPVAVVSASPHPLGGEVANKSLQGTLMMMSAVVIEGAVLMVANVNQKLNAQGNVIHEQTESQARQLVNALVESIGGTNSQNLN